jgi:CheY-like chemotaxis protein
VGLGILENLVTNAIRYTEKGHVKIDCLRAGDSIRVAVSDDGIGIPEKHIKNVFEEYFQVDNQVRDRRKGLGLGLSIVKHIGRILDHPLDVSSVLGKGSTFTVEVPLGHKIQDVKREKQKAVTSSDREPVVLFVEDDGAVLEATIMFLSIAGAKVHSALTGDDALALVAAGINPDIIISDYRLSEYNGVEVIRRVRLATADNLPAILMAGDSSVKEIDDDNIANCILLQKPVDPDKLFALISHLTE